MIIIMKNYFKVISLLVVIIILLGTGGIIGWKLKAHQFKVELEAYAYKHPINFSWKHYKEDTFMHFEVDYPDYAQPQGDGRASREDMYAYAVGFKDEIQVSTNRALQKN